MAEGFSSSAVSMTGGEASMPSTTPAGSVASDPPHHEGGIAHFFRSLFGEDDTSTAGYTDTYEEAFRRGNYGVTVTTANDAEMDRAEKILNDCGAVDIDEKSEQWKKEGWTGAALGGGAAAAAGSLQDGQSQKLQEVQEELKIGKRAVARGGVRIFTRMTEVPVEETVRLREERANVQRTAVDRPATEADFAAFKEGSIEVREMSEEAVVSKSARVTGEVSVGKEVTEREEVIRDKVRKTTVDVEKIEGSTASGKTTITRAGYTGTAGSPN
nr:YsnF/AvaK domain-containing protein [Pseudomonadota bacterium]